MYKLVFSLIFFSLFSCVEKKSGPEGVLTSFVNERFEGKSFSDVRGYLSDSYQTQMSEITGTKFEALRNLKKKKFKIISKKCNELDCNITYFVSYVTLDDKKEEFKTETKKIAKIVKLGDQWLIDKIDHIKTYHDIVDELKIEGSK